MTNLYWGFSVIHENSETQVKEIIIIIVLTICPPTMSAVYEYSKSAVFALGKGKPRQPSFCLIWVYAWILMCVLERLYVHIYMLVWRPEFDIRSLPLLFSALLKQGSSLKSRSGFTHWTFAAAPLPDSSQEKRCVTWGPIISSYHLY